MILTKMATGITLVGGTIHGMIHFGDGILVSTYPLAWVGAMAVLEMFGDLLIMAGIIGALGAGIILIMVASMDMVGTDITMHITMASTMVSITGAIPADIMEKIIIEGML